MPVYMRKRQDSLSLSQFSEANPDIDRDFVLDPDKHRDPLPQPYRFIDKVIDGLLECAFQEIFCREEERQTEQSRYKPPQVPTELCRVVPGVRSARFLCASAGDGRFVFCACDGQLLALDAVSMETLGTFEAPGLDVVHMETAELRPGLQLLATLDDLGLARLFLWDLAAFHLARLVNEDEGEKKLNCLALHVSDDGEYVALTLQNASTQSIALEFHRIPRDAWAKEAEQQQSSGSAGKGGGTTIAEEKTGQQEAATESQEEAGANTTGSAEDAARVPALKLSPINLVLRVKPPHPISGGATPSAAAATTPNFKAVDATGDVVGSGHAHLLTQSHLHLREANFRRAHESELQFLASEAADSNISLPSVLFLKPGRNVGADQANDKDQFASVAVAWSGDYRVLLYSLHKVGKDLEFRPDSVWTCGSPVTCLAASPCTALVAVGLESGNLIVYDARLGLTRHVISVDPRQAVRRVFFLNPAGLPSAEQQGQQQQQGMVYKSVQSVRAAVYTADLTPYLADLGPDVAPAARRLPTSVRHGHEAPEAVEYPRAHPGLLVRTSRSGCLVLHDVRLPKEVLQFALPPPHQLPCPWQAGGWAMAANGRSLFVRGRDDDSGDEKLFFYSLKILIPMAPYWKLQAPEMPCYAHCRAEQRADAYLQHRNATHSERQRKLADMWSNLSNTLKEVELAKAAATETPRSVRHRYYP